MSDQNSRAVTYLNEKVKEYLHTTSTYFKQIQTDRGAMQMIQEEIVKLKADKGKAGFNEAKGKIVKLQEVHYNMFLLDQSVKHLQGVIYELGTMAKVLNVELDIPEDTKEYFNTITSVNPLIFAVENGQAVMINNDMTTSVMEALQNKIHSEETLKQVYATM